jgi:hypothetical protein
MLGLIRSVKEVAVIDQTTISADCAYTGFLESVHNMHTFEFLQAILPEHGIHYLALFKDGYKFPAHKVYTDLETMADAIDNMAGLPRLRHVRARCN